MRAHNHAIGLGIFLVIGCWILAAHADEPEQPYNVESGGDLLRRLFLAVGRLVEGVPCEYVSRVRNTTIAEINGIRREAREAATKARTGIASDRAAALAEYKAKAEEIQRRAKDAGPRIEQLAKEWKAIDEKHRLGLLRKSDRRLLNEIDGNEHKILEAADDAVRSIDRWEKRKSCRSAPDDDIIGGTGIRG